MEKYDVDTSVKKRTTKNENLYSQISDMNIDYVDIDIDNAVELDPSKSGRTSREDFQKQRELNKILPRNSEKEEYMQEHIEPKEDRVYDINEILSMARKNQLFEDSEKKRLINTEYNILTKLDVGQLENENMKKEDLKSLIEDIYEKEVPKKEDRAKKYSRSEEARLLNDLFEDTITKDTIKIQEDLSKAILDKEESITVEELKAEPIKEETEEVATQINTQETNENTTTMYDFGIEKKSKKKNRTSEKDETKNQDLEEEYEEEEEGKLLIVFIIIVVILILATCGFFVYEYFFGLK